MARVTMAVLNGLTKTVARLYGYPDAPAPAAKGSKYHYKENFLVLQAESGIYGLMIVLRDGARTPFGTSRGFSAGEMEVYLNGLIDGKTHQKRR